MVQAIVGEMARFRNVKAFGTHTGLIPGSLNSADTVRSGPITKQVSTTLSWLLIQAVPYAIRSSDYLSGYATSTTDIIAGRHCG